MAGEDARLTLGIDASGAVQGARQFVDATKTVEQGAAKAGGGVAAMAKQFGLAKGQLREFGQVGASVFAGDILAKTLGFTNVMGAVSTATGLVAKGIRGLAFTLRDEFFPEIEEQRKRLEATRLATDDLRLSTERLRESLANPGFNLGGTRIDTGGLSGASLVKANDAILAAQAKVNAIDAALPSIFGGAGRNRLEDSERTLAIRKELVDARAREVEQVRKLVDALKLEEVTQANLDYEQKARIDAEAKRTQEFREQTRELAKQAAMWKTLGQGTQVSQATARFIGAAGANVAGRFSGLVPGQFSDGSAAAAGRANAQGQFREFQEMRRLAESVPGRIGPAIMSAFENSASIIARALTSGAPDPSMQYAAEGRNYIRSEEIKKATEEARQFRLEQERIAKEAKEFENLQIGQMLASGFEEAIFSGQKLSEVLRQLALDLARMVFRQTVTNQLGAAFGNWLNGPKGGGTYTNPIEPVPGTGGRSSPEGMGGGRGMSGGVGGGFRLSGRQMRENIARGF